MKLSNDNEKGLDFLKKNLKLPTEQQCLELFQEYKVPKNIFQHCLKVRKVAVFLAQKLKETGININLELVNCLALLHDLFKVVALEKLEPNQYYNFQYSEEEIAMWKQLREKYVGMHECDVAYLVFKDQFPELARSIRDVSNPFKENKSIEENIAHYADWRILNNKIISLQERLIDLQKRYLKDEEYWKKRAEIITKEEQKLFSKLNFSPEQLLKAIQND